MIRTSIFSLGALVLASGCSARMNLEVLAPAQVSVPGDIETIAFVDRSRAKNVGQGILGALEGALSGEAIGADTEGREAAADGIVAILEESPRFDVIAPMMTNKEVQSSLFDKEMDIEVLQKICPPGSCQAVVSLEALDSDSDTEFTTEIKSETVEGKEVKSTEWTAVRTTDVLTAWRLYDVKSGAVLDSLRDYKYARSWSGTGKTKGAARRSLPGQIRTVRVVAEHAGANYGRRIAPHYVWVSRPWYAGGSDQMKMARVHVRSDNWTGATDIWRAIASNGADPKLQGKAHFNLALAAEVEGDLNRALEEASRAASLLNNGKSRRYVRILRQRQIDQQRLWEQMGTTLEDEAGPPEPAVEDAPLAIPGNTPAPPADAQ